MGWGPTEKGREVGVGTKPSGYGGSLSRRSAPMPPPPPQIHSETKGRRKSWPREWRQREKGGKAGKGGMYTNRQKKERSPPLAFSPNFAPLSPPPPAASPVGSGKPLQFETFQLQPRVALPPFFAFYFVLPLYFRINSYGDQRCAVGVYINAPSLFAGPFIPNRRYPRASLVLPLPF